MQLLNTVGFKQLTSIVTNFSWISNIPENELCDEGTKLPMELINPIFEQFSLQDFTNYRSTCKKWYSAEGDRALRLFLLIGSIGQKSLIRLTVHEEMLGLMPGDITQCDDSVKAVKWLRDGCDYHFAKMLFSVGCAETFPKETTFPSPNPSDHIINALLLEARSRIGTPPPAPAQVLAPVPAPISTITLEEQEQELTQDQKIVECLKFYATKGCIKSNCFLGQFYLYGDSISTIPASYSDANKYLEIAARMKERIACYELGVYFLSSVPKLSKAQKSTQAIYWLKISADAGTKAAQQKLAVQYFDLNKKDDAQIYFERAAAQGDLSSHYWLYQIHSDWNNGKRKIKKAEKHLIKSADLGYAPSQMILSLRYCEGHDGFEHNIEKARLYAELAAKQNVPDALQLLCRWHKYGISVEKNDDKAIGYFNKLSDLSKTAKNSIRQAFALFECGKLYELGLFTSNQWNNAFNCYLEAIKIPLEHDRVGSLLNYRLATFYEEGGIISEDPVKAITHYKLAADQNHPTSCFKMCQLLSQNVHGILVDEQPDHYFKMLVQSAEQNPAGLVYGYISLCYTHGWGVEQDLSTALMYLEVAANQGHAAAQFRLCVRYSKGDDVVKKDIEKAAKFFELLTDPNHNELLNGYRVSERFYHIAECYEKGFGTDIDLKKAADYNSLASLCPQRPLIKTWIL